MALIECKKCSKQISDTARKCPHCGMRIIPKIMCPECREFNSESDISCRNCGYVFGKNSKLKNEYNKIKNTLPPWVKFVAIAVLIMAIIILGSVVNYRRKSLPFNPEKFTKHYSVEAMVKKYGDDYFYAHSLGVDYYEYDKEWQGMEGTLQFQYFDSKLKRVTWLVDDERTAAEVFEKTKKFLNKKYGKTKDSGDALTWVNANLGIGINRETMHLQVVCCP